MTIGETLHAAREAKGFSVQDVVTATRMTARQVTDMEGDDFSSFAYPFYAKVFLRQFARSVGLDPEPIVARWVAESGSAGGASVPHAPIVPLETIDEESGGLRVVKPEVPSDAQKPSGDESRSPRRPDCPEKRLAPLPEPPPKDDSPRPEKRVAAADPAVAAAAAAQTAVSREAPPPPSGAAPLPVKKRVAGIRPGEVAPEPVSLRAPELVASREIRPVRDLPPVVKKIPVDQESDAVPVSSSAPATVPDFIETSAPAFVFPGTAPTPVPPAVSAPVPPASAGEAEAVRDVPPSPVAPSSAPSEASASASSLPAASPPEPAGPVDSASAAPPPAPAPESDADLPLFSLRPEPAPASVPAVESAEPAPSAPSPASLDPVEDDDSPFGGKPARRRPFAALADAAASAVSALRRRGTGSRAGGPFGGADILAEVDSPSRRFPVPSRPVAVAGAVVVAALVVAGAFFSGSGSDSTPAPVDSDIEEESVEPAPVPAPSASASGTATAPVPAPSASVSGTAPAPAREGSPEPLPPPAAPTPLFPPPRSFAR